MFIIRTDFELNEVSVPKKPILAVLAMATVLSGTAFYKLPAAAQGPPQSRQSQAEKEMLDRQIKEANKKRQQDIHDDTEKLFQLASELKEAVGKSNENLLSLDVVRKAEEVEKLAKKVKDKMKEAIGPGPRFDTGPQDPRLRPPQ